MRRDSQRLFERIQFLGSVMVLYIQITVIVIVNGIQTVSGSLLARWVYMVIKLLGMRTPKLRDFIRLAGVHKQVATA